MKPKYSVSSPISTICLAVACLFGATHNALSESYTYDADTATAGAQDGSGLGWNTTSINWLLNGSDPDVAWPNLITDTAVFGSGGTIANAAAGTVTVGTVNVGLIEFKQTVTTGYTLAPTTGSVITLGEGITTTSTIANTISAVITGSNGLVFNGVANATNGVTLSGLNTYTGITTATNGRLSGTGATPFGSTAGATASALGLNYTESNTGTTVQVGNSTAEAFLISGTGSFPSGNAPGALRMINGVTLSSLVQLAGNAFVGGNFGVGTMNGNVNLEGFTMTTGNGNNPLTLTINGVVSTSVVGDPPTPSGGSIVILTGSGSANVINLTNPLNSYAGNTQVSGGTVFGAGTLPSNGTLGLGGDSVLGTSTLVFAGGNVRSTNSTARTISNTIGNFSGGATFGERTTQTGALNFTSTAAPSLGTTAKTFTTHVDTTFAAEFSGSSNLTKAGAAKLTLTGTSTRTGSTTVTAGTLLINNTAGSGTGTGSVTVNNLVGAVTSAEAGVAAANAVRISGVSNVTAGTLQIGQAITGTNIPADTIITGISIGTTGTNTSFVAISKTIVPATANVAFSTTAFNSSPILGGTGIIAPTGTNSLLVNSGSTLGLVDNVIESLEVDLTGTTGGATFDPGAALAFELGASSTSDSVSFSGLDDSALTFNNNVINLATTGDIAAGNYTYTLMTFSPSLAAAPTLQLGTLPLGVSGASLIQTADMVQVSVTYTPPYDTFINSFPSITGADKLPTADPDGDGLTNQQEFAFGLSPDSGASVNPYVSVLNKTTGLFTYTRRGPAVSGLAFTYEYSTTLASWLPFTPDSVSTNGGSPVEEITVDVPNALLTNTRLFIRVIAK